MGLVVEGAHLVVRRHALATPAVEAAIRGKLALTILETNAAIARLWPGVEPHLAELWGAIATAVEESRAATDGGAA